MNIKMFRFCSLVMAHNIMICEKDVKLIVQLILEIFPICLVLSVEKKLLNICFTLKESQFKIVYLESLEVKENLIVRIIYLIQK